MIKEDFIERIKTIGLMENDVDMRTALTELSDELLPLFDKVDSLEANNNKYKSDNEKLREANMQLFLRIGSKTPEEARKEETGVETKEPLQYKDLFDENGNLR